MPATRTLHPTPYLCGARRVASWLAQSIAALILLQTLFFKFTGAPESVHIFTIMGMEPWGRFASGAAELTAAVLLLVPRTAHVGAAIALAVMTGALGSHVTKLGITIPSFAPDGTQLPGNDGGLLFGLACAVSACSAVVLFLRRAQARADALSLLSTLRPRLAAH